MSDDLFSTLRSTMGNAVTFLEKGRPFPVSPTPLVIPCGKYRTICADAFLILEALEKAALVVRQVPRLWAQFPELHSVEKCLGLPRATARMIDLARFDLAILKNGGFRMMESNAACPGALTTVGDINSSFANTEGYREIAAKIIPQPIDSKFYFVDYLASLISADLPKHLAFISSRHRPIVTDLERLTELANERGYLGIRCEVQDLRFEDGHLMFGSRPIHAAFLKFDTVVTSGGVIDLGIYGPDDDMSGPFYRALSDGAFAYVNSFDAQLLVENKRILAMLPQGEVQAVLTKAEKDAIARIVAPTYSLYPEELERLGGRNRLIEEKDKWVIKKVLETRGRGVHIGKYCTKQEWHDVVSSPSLDRSIAQEYVELAIQNVHMPIFEDNGYFDAYTDMGLYLLGGNPMGFLCRASRSPIVNVGKSGALRPTFVTEN